MKNTMTWRALPARTLLASAITAILAFSSLPTSAAVSTANLNVARMMHSANTLPDGKVLISGGTTTVSNSTPSQNSSEIYDPVSGNFTPAAPMLGARRYHAGITLSDGRILVAGGATYVNSTYTSLASAEIYDPASGQWSAVGNLSGTQYMAGGLALPNGRAMVFGAGSNTSYSAEVFDPASGSFTRTGGMLYPATYFGMLALPDGRVLKMGGMTASGFITSVEIWNPATNTWSTAGNLLGGRAEIAPTLLANGKVLVAGGRNAGYNVSAEIYDPATGTSVATADLPEQIMSYRAVTMADGNILLVDNYKRLLRYNVSTGQWNKTGPQRNNARDLTVTPLSNGKILFSGGADLNDASNAAMLFDPVCASQLNSLSVSKVALSDAATGFSVNVNVAPGCAFDVGTLPDWLSAGNTGPFTGSTSLYFNSSNNTGPSRTVTLKIAEADLQIDQNSSACASSSTSSVSPLNYQLVSNGAGSGTLSISTSSTCAWSLENLPSWITTYSATSGKGNASISYNVAANTTGADRVASLKVRGLGGATGLNPTVTQPGTNLCPNNLVVSPMTFNFSGNASSGSFTISGDATCPWSISNLPSWMTLTSPANGSGNATINYTVAANSGAARSSSGQVANLKSTVYLNINQAAATCTGLSSSPSYLSFTSSANSGSFTVNAPASCNWTLSNVPAWFTVSRTSGTGNATVTYSLPANTSTSSRTAYLGLAGGTVSTSVSLAQAGYTPQCSSNPVLSQTFINVPATATTGSLNVTASLDCNWSVSAPSWMSITSGASGTGNGTINYSIAANTGAARSASGQISAPGFASTFNVSQAAGTPPPSACTSTAINSGVAVNGNLLNTACTSGARGSSYYTDRYTFTSSGSRPVTIFLSASSFDTYLYLKDPNGTVIKSDDDGGGGTNSRIPAGSGSFTLPAVSGTYTIEVSSYSTFKTGAYSLTYTQN